MQSRHLWIGGVGTHTIKEQLEAELRKFGPIEEFKILRDRHCAFVDFVRLDDAIAALEGLHRKRVGNDELRVEYGRNYIAKRVCNYICMVTSGDPINVINVKS